MTGDWIAAAVGAAGPCPACGSTAVKPITYGMPDFDAFRDMEDRVVFAGCIVPEVARPYACGRCGEQWGGTGR